MQNEQSGEVASTLPGCADTRLLHTLEKDIPGRGVGKLTQDEVSKTLGPPEAVHQLSDGGVIWRYRYIGSYVSGQEGRVSGGSSCAEYILNFSSDKVLRQTRRQTC